jgi:hypothetical protein
MNTMYGAALGAPEYVLAGLTIDFREDREVRVDSKPQVNTPPPARRCLR